MRFRNIELWLALAAIAMITTVYLVITLLNGVPAASGWIGHSIGIIGFLLMLLTEILYSLRKRYLRARWGRMQHWLSFHIFTGLVGPYMVLLHSSWKFNGLAGVLMLMTVVIVASGFVGRYFYTAVPRDADGTILEVEQLNLLIAQNKQQLEHLRSSHPELVRQVNELIAIQSAGRFNRIAIGQQWRKLEKETPGKSRGPLHAIREYWERQATLERQLKSMAGARRLLAIWHTLHVPLGVVVFTVAFIHIGAALYYATFIH